MEWEEILGWLAFSAVAVPVVGGLLGLAIGQKIGAFFKKQARTLKVWNKDHE
jgi:hypothetical protein